MSGRFARLYQEVDPSVNQESVYLYRKLAADRINIVFLSLDFLRNPRQITCMVAPGAAPATAGQGHDQGAAGLVSLFPHRFDPAAIAAVFAALGQRQIPWYAMASSGSMLTVVTDFAVQQQAAEALAEYAQLPPGHGPLRVQQDYDDIARRLKSAPETVAQYVEARIRTYGIAVKTGLKLCRIDFHSHEQVLLGRALEGLAADKAGFAYICANRTADGQGHLAVALDPGQTPADAPDIAAYLAPALCSSRLEIRENVEMLCFHGPHFGDRYGIADKALGCLINAGVPVWLAGCVGATVSIIVPPGMGEPGVEALSTTFDRP